MEEGDELSIDNRYCEKCKKKGGVRYRIKRFAGDEGRVYCGVCADYIIWFFNLDRFGVKKR